MSFTDDDIDRVKGTLKNLKKIRAEGDCKAQTMSMTLEEWDALFSRLEATRQALEETLSHGLTDNCEKCKPYIEKWKKTAGII